MSFWSSYQTRPTQKRFEDTRSDHRIVRIESYSPEIRLFLQEFFGATAALKSRPPPFSSAAEFVVARTPDGALLGCGHVATEPSFFEGHPVHATDWLCVVPAHRNTGLTSRILSVGYSYLRDKGIHHCIYLKEGQPMRMTSSPLYSSTYLFRRILGSGDLKNSLSPPRASRLMAQIRRVRPDTFILHSETLLNQTWRFWKWGLSWILMGFQDAYQSFEGGTVGTLSAFFSAGPVLKAEFEALLDSAPFSWIWADSAFVKDAEGWTVDGPFHWYAYQWATCLPFSDQYCLMA
jgi:GNAT superfamily N-acetyltransferase